MRIIPVFFVLALLAGCSQPATTLAGGKPVAYWVQSLKDRDPKIRKQAAFKLGNVGISDPSALPALIDALKDADVHVRKEVILALVKFGADGESALPALTEVERTDRDTQVRSFASKAIEKLRGQQ